MFKTATPLFRGLIYGTAATALSIGIVYAAGYHVAEQHQTEPTQVTVEMLSDYYLPELGNPVVSASTGDRAKLRNTDPHRSVLAEKPQPQTPPNQ
jgi:hypothetical protein